MLVTPCNLDSVTQHTHYKGNTRSYDITILDPAERTHRIEYTENTITEYIIPSGTAISGSDSGHYFGVICDSNFYFGNPTKGNKLSRTKSPFWKKFHPKKSLGTHIEFLIEDKPKHIFSDPVNLSFSLNAYWHWFNEDLPLFKYFRTNDHKIITNKLSAWQKESLEHLPDIRDRIVELDTPCVVEAPEFHMFTKPDGTVGKNSAWTTKFLMDTFLPAKSSQDRKIYISRNKDAQARGVDNEDEVREFLGLQGFEFYENFSELSLQDKLDLLHSCQVVVSATGANLSHVYAMRPGTKVVDFNHKFLLDTEHWYNNIGNAAGLKWITCGMETGSPAKRPKMKNNNLVVDIKLLGKALEL